MLILVVWFIQSFDEIASSWNMDKTNKNISYNKVTIQNKYRDLFVKWVD